MATFKEINESAMRGNMVDLAIGAITGGLDFSHHFIGFFKGVTSAVVTEAAKQRAVLGWGNCMTIAVNFLIIAFIWLLVVRALYSVKKSQAPTEPAPSRSEVLLQAMRGACQRS
jgi:large conductance mechanosensitive channel